MGEELAELLRACGVLRVCDDGTGFTAPTRSSGGLGLDGMRERVRHLNGALTIQSGGSKGTEVTVTVPIGAEEEERTP